MTSEGLLGRVGLSPFEVRWIRRHPVRFVRIVGFHFTFAGLLAVKATIIGNPVFAENTFAPGVWPGLLGIAAGIVAASAVLPLLYRLQAAFAAALFSIFLLRMATYIDAVLRFDLSPGGRAIALSFAVHWGILTLVAMYWPAVSERSGRLLVVESGRDERGE